MRPTELSAFVIAALVLAGCAHDPGPPPPIDLAGLNCPATYDIGSLVVLQFNPKKETSSAITLDATSKCVSENDGAHSLYRIFALPQAEVPYLVMVSAQPWANTILAPRLIFLNSNGDTVRATAPSDFIFRGNNLSAILQHHANEAYMAVASDTDALGASITRITDSTRSGVYGNGRFFFYVATGSDTTTNLTLSATGNATVAIAPLPSQ